MVTRHTCAPDPCTRARPRRWCCDLRGWGRLPKYFWLIIVIILPDVGSIAWLLLGRPVGAGFRLGSQVGVYKPQKRAIGPEDSPDFLASIERKRLQSWEQELKRREEELRRKEDEDDSPS